MKIPIREAMNSGDWFHCDSKVELYEQITDIEFRLRVLSFEEVNIKDVDKPERIDTTIYNLEEGNFWLLKFEIVNLTKYEISTGIFGLIKIIDQDDFSFSVVIDEHLCGVSNYARKYSLDKIVLASEIFPKIKNVYVCAYFLPKEDNTEYYLSILNGKIEEV